ncbi:MAG TPA: proline--tRNA ligase, partial [Candidatus Gracilibacteria bacterium]
NITPIMKHFAQSPKDFPKCVYQIQNKFRNEPRAKSGIMRGREFLMKDAYSFHLSDACFMDFYEKMKEVYLEVYKQLGLGDLTFITVASGGDFTEKFSHEFQTLCPVGEDEIYYDEKHDLWWNKEIAPAIAPAVDEKDTETKERQDVKGENIVGVQELADFFGIPVEKTTKTMLFEDEKGNVIAAAVRGGYDINEIKLKNVLGCKSLKLASPETVRRITRSEVGYAGILDLPKEVRIIMDDSVGGRLNFECGANKTDHHSINVNFGRDIPLPEKFYDIKVAKACDLNPETNKPYRVEKAAEVGNIFPLETKFSDAFDFKVDGNRVIMGSYGIGVSRVMGVMAELFSDEKGLIWPANVAPFQVYLAPIGKNDAVYAKTEDLYKSLNAAGIEVLYDDRQDKKTSPGQKFADHELLGIPYRVVLSETLLEKNQAEVVARKDGKVEMIDLDQLIKYFS